MYRRYINLFIYISIYLHQWDRDAVGGDSREPKESFTYMHQMGARIPERQGALREDVPGASLTMDASSLSTRRQTQPIARSRGVTPRRCGPSLPLPWQLVSSAYALKSSRRV